MAIGNNQRKEERINVALPVRMGDALGVTRDVAISGICFETEADCVAGTEISFAIELEILSEKRLLKCKGVVVRTEPQDGKVGVAVRIIDSAIEVAA